MVWTTRLVVKPAPIGVARRPYRATRDANPSMWSGASRHEYAGSPQDRRQLNLDEHIEEGIESAAVRKLMRTVIDPKEGVSDVGTPVAAVRVDFYEHIEDRQPLTVKAGATLAQRTAPTSSHRDG